MRLRRSLARLALAVSLVLWLDGACALAPAVAQVRRPVRRVPVPVRPRVTAGYLALRQKVLAALQQAPHFAEGASLPVYQLLPVEPRQLEQSAVSLANRILRGLGGGQAFSTATLQTDGDYMVARNDKGVKLRAYAKSGFISVINQERVFHGRCDTLTDTQAADIARKFVSDNRVVDLGANEKLTVADVRRVRSQTVEAKSGRRTEAVLNNTVVILERQLAGKRVIGPGGRLVVFLGGAGEVVGLQRNWRELGPVAPDRVRAKGLAAVADSVMSELRRMFGESPPAVRMFQVARVDCGYWAGSKHRAQRFLQPAYVLHIQVRGEQTSQMAEGLLISAADRVLEPLVPAPAETVGQPRTPRAPAPGGGDD